MHSHPVRPVILTKPGISAVIEEGESAELSCTAVAGSPPPQLRWRKLLGPLPTGEQARDGGLLKLEAVRRDHAGNYVCEADNGFGNTPVTSLVRVQVECESLHEYFCKVNFSFFRWTQHQTSQVRRFRDRNGNNLHS